MSFFVYWILPFIGAGGIMSFLLWFWQKPKLVVEFEPNDERPEEIIVGIYNEPLTNKLAGSFHVQRKTAEHVLVQFIVRDIERKEIPNQNSAWIQATVITGHGFPSARVSIPPSIVRSHFQIGRIHPDSKAFHLEGNGTLPSGNYVVIVQVEDDGKFKHATRQLNITTWPPYAFWVGRTTPLQSLIGL